jgi:hypothetical protein
VRNGFLPILSISSPTGIRMTVAVMVKTAMTAPMTVEEAPKLTRYNGRMGRVR